MKYGTGESAVYLCNFCGRSSWGNLSSFHISELDGETVICEHCLPLILSLLEPRTELGTSISMVPREPGAERPDAPAWFGVHPEPEPPVRFGLRGLVNRLSAKLVAFAGRP